MKEWIVRMLVMSGIELLKIGADALWDAFWEVVAEAMREAEKQWRSGYGDEKKKQVIEAAITWVSERKRLSLRQKIALKILLGRVIDRLVSELNTKTGKDWASQVPNIKERVRQLLPPIIRDVVN